LPPLVALLTCFLFHCLRISLAVTAHRSLWRKR
jgi:hypothetical protein